MAKKQRTLSHLNQTGLEFDPPEAKFVKPKLAQTPEQVAASAVLPSMPAPEPPPDPILALLNAPKHIISPFDASHAKNVLTELARRKIEGLRLYEPLPIPAAFHASHAPERLLRGSNRASKTLSASVEVSRAVTGQDPHNKYPKKDGICYVVARDLKHIADPIWKELGRAGAFRIIRDLWTGEWRTYRPWTPDDANRFDQTKLAPPLIPPRLIKSIAWEKRNQNQPSKVVLHNGWEICFFSSEGNMPQGVQVDLAWFDEEIPEGQNDWYAEISARLLDRRGKFIWSATPQAGTDQLFDLHERCEKQAFAEKPSCQEYHLLLRDNPYISDEEKQLIADKLNDPDKVAVRVHGEYAVLGYKVYPEFSMKIHGMDMEGEPPRNWTRYMVVDPGHQICAVLFGCVPPPSEGDFILLYKELYLPNCDAEIFAKAVAATTQGETIYASIIDNHAGRVTQVAAGMTIEQQYMDALRKHKFRAVKTGQGFIWGSDDIEAGVSAVKLAMRPREDGTPRLRILRGRLPSFEWEIKRYHNKRVEGKVVDKPDNRKSCHLMDDLRYLISAQPRYYKLQPGKQTMGGAIRAFRERQKRQKDKTGPSYVRLG